MIEKKPDNNVWENLGAPVSKDSVAFEFMESDENKLHSIRLKARESYHNIVIMIGDVKFVIG